MEINGSMNDIQACIEYKLIEWHIKPKPNSIGNLLKDFARSVYAADRKAYHIRSMPMYRLMILYFAINTPLTMNLFIRCVLAYEWMQLSSFQQFVALWRILMNDIHKSHRRWILMMEFHSCCLSYIIKPFILKAILYVSLKEISFGPVEKATISIYWLREITPLTLVLLTNTFELTVLCFQCYAKNQPCK